MTATEYIFIFYSFILALAVAEVLQGVGTMLRRKKVRFSLLHIAWVGLILISILQFWWGSWPLQAMTKWSLSGMLVGFTSTLLLYLAAFTSFPSDIHENEDMEGYYFQESKTLWILFALYVVSGALAGRVIFGQAWGVSIGDLLIFVVILLCVWSAFSKRKLIHWFVLSFFYVSGIAVTLVTQTQIGSP